MLINTHINKEPWKSVKALKFRYSSNHSFLFRYSMLTTLHKGNSAIFHNSTVRWSGPPIIYFCFNCYEFLKKKRFIWRFPAGPLLPTAATVWWDFFPVDLGSINNGMRNAHHLLCYTNYFHSHFILLMTLKKLLVRNFDFEWLWLHCIHTTRAMVNFLKLRVGG